MYMPKESHNWKAGVNRLLATTLVFAHLLFSFAHADNSNTVEVAQPSHYLDAIDLVEAEQGAYSEQLSDLYLSLGRAFIVQEDFQNAKQAFEQGMQIERINNGLYSISQRPYLLSIADTESYLGNWKQSRKALDNLYFINRQIHGNKSPKLIPVLDEILNWFLKTYDQRTTSGGYENLIVAERIGETIDAILTNDANADPLEKAKLYKKLASLHYMLADHIREHGDKNNSGVTFSTGETSVNNQSLTSSHLHYQRGKRALEKVVAALVTQETNNHQQQALAIAQLGDWYLIFGQRQAAQRTYKLAFDSLANDSLTEENPPQKIASPLFDNPTLIKFSIEEFIGEPVKQETSSLTLDENTIEVSMTISYLGRVSNVEVFNTEQNITDKQLSNLRRNLRKARYRPKIVDGVTIESVHSEFFQASILER